MKTRLRNMRAVLCASTAFWALGAAVAHAGSPDSASLDLNLGSVVAGGQQDQGGYVAPSATGSLAQAQKLKKLSPNVIAVQPQSQIQKLPDRNLADALQRVPGVEVVSDSGEGDFVNIRGLDADLNGTTFDGVHLTASNQSTPTGGARAPELAAFPSGLVGGVEVVKSLTPDMEAEGLGGNVNLLPIAMPADGQTVANFSGALGEETLRNTGIYQGNITLGQSFAIPGMRSFANAHPFSVLFNYNIDSDRRGIDDVEEDYDPATPTTGQNADLDDLQLRYYQEHRVRQGLSGEIDFDPSPQTHFFLRAVQGGYNVEIQKDRLELQNLDSPPGGGDGIYTVHSAKPSERYTYQDQKVATSLIEFGGRTILGDVLNVDARGSWTQGSSILPFDYVSTFKGSKVAVTYNTSNPDYRTYSAAGGVNLADPSRYDLSSVSNTPQRSFDQEFNGAVNASFATSTFGYIGEAKFGAEARLRSEGTVQYEFDNNNANTINLANVTGGNRPIYYYNPDYEIGPNLNYGQFLSQVTFGPDSGPDAGNQTFFQTFAHNTENVYAGYGQETIELGKLEVLAGARVEITNGTYRAFAGSTDINGDTTYTANTNKQDYINVFPSAQLKYAFNDQFQIRAAYSTAIARPGFQQISAAETIDQSQDPVAITQGNPNLKPTTGNSFDLTAEYYSPHDGLLSVNAFYKLFNDYIVSTLSNGTYNGPAGPQAAQITTFDNISGAFARGLELDAEQKFYFLPEPLDGFGVDANVTFVDSRGRSDGPQYKAYQLPETSPITFNTALFYEKGPFDFRVAAGFVSRNLYAVSSADPADPRSVDQFSSARLRVDMEGSFQATPRVQIYANAQNLTNSPLQFTQSSSNKYPIQREFYNVDYLVGVRLKLGS